MALRRFFEGRSFGGDMSGNALRAVIYLAIAYALATAVFTYAGANAVEATLGGAGYAIMAFAAMLFSRGLLEIFVNIYRDAAFFVVLRKLTDPFLALCAPLTPGFLVDFARSLHAAFILYMMKVLLLGDDALDAPPIWLLLLINIG